MRQFSVMLAICIGFCCSIVNISSGEEQSIFAEILSDDKNWIEDQIEALNSSDPVKKGRAALVLGNSGESALPAIPYLVNNLGSGIALMYQVKAESSSQWKDKEETNPGREAAIALVKIGRKYPEEVIPHIIKLIKESDAKLAKGRAAFILKAIGVPSDYSETLWRGENFDILEKEGAGAYITAQWRAIEESYQDYDKLKEWWDKNRETFSSPWRDITYDQRREGIIRGQYIPY
ncbi:MAG: hypothetical protein JW869_04865 [Candidatus Omnitrophica bacterium]|nr:hypothetical protein [Candidatus Omnitrophota bacterium]